MTIDSEELIASEVRDPHLVAALDEAQWYARAYRGDVPQLTPRAVLTGLLLGFVLSFANVYIGLKTGWFFGMAIAAGLASFGAWRLLHLARLARTPLSLLETTCMQSTASSAAYATGNMVVGVIPAMLLLSVSPAHPHGEQPPALALIAWIACIAALGVTLAVPMKRQLINRERLAFPSGTAAAITLAAMHARGAAAVTRTRVLLAALAAGVALPVLRDVRGLALIPSSSRLFDWLPRVTAAGQTFAPSEAGLVLDHSVLLLAAGVFAGLRTTLWMLVGGLVTAFVIGPPALEAGATSALGMTWAECGIWVGAPVLVAYAVVSLVGYGRAIARTLRRPAVAAAPEPAVIASIEIPRAWFWWGFALFGALAIVLGQVLWGIPMVLGALAVALSLVFSTVACRITGETDITPGGPMGKLTQLAFGALHPHVPATNLLTASMTHASSVAAADLLTDLKCGYLLGAHPRKQFAAQAIGIGAGALGSVLAYFLLVPDASALVGTAGHAPAFAAPGAHQFQAIAELLQDGLGKLLPLHRALVVIGALGGLVVATAERLAPVRVARWLPSAAGLGLGLLLPLSTSLAMALGAAAAALASARVRDASARFTWPIAAGLLAGESLAGVAVALVNVLR